MKKLTYGLILKAWLGHYITGKCAIGLIKMKKDRERAERIAREEAKHCKHLASMVDETTRYTLKENERLLAITKETLA